MMSLFMIVWICFSFWALDCTGTLILCLLSPKLWGRSSCALVNLADRSLYKSQEKNIVNCCSVYVLFIHTEIVYISYAVYISLVLYSLFVGKKPWARSCSVPQDMMSKHYGTYHYRSWALLRTPALVSLLVMKRFCRVTTKAFCFSARTSPGVIVLVFFWNL